jgi:hypothetical protein
MHYILASKEGVLYKRPERKEEEVAHRATVHRPCSGLLDIPSLCSLDQMAHLSFPSGSSRETRDH